MTGAPPHAEARPSARAASSERAEPPARDAWRRLRRVGEACLWLLVIGVAVVAALRVAAELRLVVLPVALAIVLATFLAPPAQWLRSRGAAPALAAVTVVAAGLLVLAGVAALLVPPVIDQFGQLDVELTDAVDRLQRWLEQSPLPLSGAEIGNALDDLQSQLRESVDAIVGPVLSGAMLLLEVLAGLVLAVVVLFFLLKDGERIWGWVVGLAPPARRDDVRAMGARVWDALAGFVRGQTLVALFDAVLIGVALAVVGVPLVLPLAVLTFFGAYVPVIGATVTGLLAVVVALVDQGVVAAVIVLAAIIVVQQLEGNVFQPIVVGRAVHAHPLAILLGVTAGGVLAGIIGAMLAAPIVAVSGAVLAHLRSASHDGEAEDVTSPE